MSDTKNYAASGPATAGYPATTPGKKKRSWAGMIVFSGVMLMLVGAFQAMMGLVALFNSAYYLVTRTGLVVEVNYTTWGWVHLILGAIAVVTGFGVLAGQTWARITGIALAAVSAIVSVAFLAASPVWTTIVIAIDVLIVYALAVHGKEIRDV